MKKYEIWMEGFAITGDSSGASYVGSAEGASFEEACAKKMAERGSTTYDPKRNTDWGCKLFDNEVDARKSFG